MVPAVTLLKKSLSVNDSVIDSLNFGSEQKLVGSIGS